MNTRLHRRFAALAAALGLAAVAGIAAWAAQPEGAAAASAPEPDAPGDAHALLTSLAGEWTTLSTLHVDGVASGEPDAGTARVESIIDGRFIAIHETGTMLGEPFDALKLLGFNNEAGLYEATWVYTGSTATMRGRGIDDPTTGVLTFQAQYASGPDTNERFIFTLAPSPDAADPAAPPSRFAMTLVALLDDGTAGPTMETVYTRIP